MQYIYLLFFMLEYKRHNCRGHRKSTNIDLDPMQET